MKCIAQYLRNSDRVEHKLQSNEANSLHADPHYLTALASLGSSVPAKLMAAPANNSIAVLPFVDMSGEAGHEHFTDGLTEDIITDLSNVSGFFVIARNSVFAYKGKPTDVRQIAHDLGVKYILEGSARRSEKRLRINVQLIDAAGGGNHVWAERFDRDLTDIFEVQDELTRRIVETISGKIGSASRQARQRPSNLEAYDLVVRSRNQYAQSRNAAAEARIWLERAIALDPNYAEAHWQLAGLLVHAWAHRGVEFAADLDAAFVSAQRAVDMDPNDSGAHTTMGYVLTNKREWDAAKRSYDRALQLSPNDADTIAEFAYFEMVTGSPRECIADMMRAIRLNPFPPSWYFWVLGDAHFDLGQFGQAVETLRHHETYRTTSRKSLAAALAMLGRIDEAKEEANGFMADNPGFSISYWRSQTPTKNQSEVQALADAYRLAGLPE